jgi:hypothetical protein
MHGQSSIVGGGEPRSGGILATRVANGAAGIGLIVGAGAGYLVTQASTAALATTSRVLLTTGLAGLVLMAAVVALGIFARGHGRGDHQPGQRILTSTRAGFAAELFPASDGGRLRGGPVQPTDANAHERRRAA